MTPEYLFDSYTKAVYNKDVTAYLALYDEQLNAYDMWQQWSYEGLPAWREMTNGWFNGLGTNRDEVSFTEVSVQENGDMALLTAIAKFAAVSDKGETLRFLQNRLTWVAIKKEESWKIIHQHTSSPIDFETMKPILNK